MESNQIKAAVLERYGEVARGEATCGSLCGCAENPEGLAIRLHQASKTCSVSTSRPPNEEYLSSCTLHSSQR
jgi:hypothetical protein